LASRKIDTQTKAVVCARSRGICEYGSCRKRVLEIQDGKRLVTGEFAHILPKGDGPRAEYLATSKVPIDSARNIMLLCPNHHTLVDQDDIEGHPPAILFAMLMRKADLIEDAVIRRLEELSDDLSAAAIEESLKIGHLMDLIEEYRSGGPRFISRLQEAERVAQEAVKNPHTENKDLFRLLRILMFVTRSITTFDATRWVQLMERGEQEFERIRSPWTAAAAVRAMIHFLRNEFNAAAPTQLVGLRKLLMDRVDGLLPTAQAVELRTRLLTLRAALLRWQGRSETSHSLRVARFDEAERCAAKSLSLTWSGAAELQRILALFSRFWNRGREEVEEAEKERSEISRMIADPKLDHYPPAVKARPRLFREIGQFDKAVAAFWEADPAGYSWDMRRIAFILMEAITAEVRYPGMARPAGLSDAVDYVDEALERGFHHGHNITSWIVGHSLLDPEWFRSRIFDRIRHVTDIRSEEGKRDWTAILRDCSPISAAEHSEDLLFGVDSCHFWNIMARTTRIALNDAEAAVEFHEIARRHAEVRAHNFAIRIGLTRAHAQAGDLVKASQELGNAGNYARAHHMGIIDQVRSELAAMKAQRASGAAQPTQAATSAAT
jgi:hypothetical protein